MYSPFFMGLFPPHFGMFFFDSHSGDTVTASTASTNGSGVGGLRSSSLGVFPTEGTTGGLGGEGLPRDGQQLFGTLVTVETC